MSTTGIVTHYIGWGCQSPNPRNSRFKSELCVWCEQFWFAWCFSGTKPWCETRPACTIPWMCLQTPSFCQIHCTANDYSTMLFIMICKILVLPMLFLAFQCYTQSHSYSPNNLSSAFFTWFSHLHLILYARVSIFSCSVAFLVVINLPEHYFLTDMQKLSNNTVKITHFLVKTSYSICY